MHKTEENEHKTFKINQNASRPTEAQHILHKYDFTLHETHQQKGQALTFA